MGFWADDMALKRKFHVRDLAKLLDTNARRIEGWVEQGLLRPKTLGAGPGWPHEFSLDNLIQGAILLELQRTFGEKSPVWGRASSGVVNAVKGFSLDVPKKLFLIVGQEGGEVRETAVIKGGMSELTERLKDGLEKHLTMTIVDITGIIMKLHEKLKWYKE